MRHDRASLLAYALASCIWATACKTDHPEGGNKSTEPLSNTRADPSEHADSPSTWWLIHVATAEDAKPLIAIGHGLRNPAYELRIVAAPTTTGYALLVGPPMAEQGARQLLTIFKKAAPAADVTPCNVPPQPASHRNCLEWTRELVSASFFELSPLDLPYIQGPFAHQALDSQGDYQLQAIPYYDPKDHDGNTEGMLQQVALSGPGGTHVLTPNCTPASGKFAPDGTLVVLECPHDVLGDVIRHEAQVYHIPSGKLVGNAAPCRKHQWQADGTLRCDQEQVDTQGQLVRHRPRTRQIPIARAQPTP